MKGDADLRDVAAHLSRDAADLLSRESSDRQVAALVIVRTVATYWEERSLLVDPMTYQLLLDGVVTSALSGMEAMEAMKKGQNDDFYL